VIEVEVEIEDSAWSDADPEVEHVVHRVVIATLADEHMGEVTVLLTDDEAVADLNARFRNKPGSTNVLSFPAAPTAKPHLGDLALAFGVCAREAEAQGKSLRAHLQHLVAHGALHLVGFDHQTDDEAEVMEAREREILARLGVPDPYAMDGDASVAPRQR
jgi:probable rRNA maturation factor